MNSACLIAACAVNSRRNNEHKYIKHIDKELNFYYGVKYRMYLHFNSVEAIILDKINSNLSPTFGDFIPQSCCLTKRITIEPKTICKQHTFSINSKKCPAGIDDYIKDNKSEFEDSSIWDIDKYELINMYKKWVEDKYNVILDDSYLDYNIQFCYEIESVE